MRIIRNSDLNEFRTTSRPWIGARIFVVITVVQLVEQTFTVFLAITITQCVFVRFRAIYSFRLLVAVQWHHIYSDKY